MIVLCISDNVAQLIKDHEESGHCWQFQNKIKYHHSIWPVPSRNFQMQEHNWVTLQQHLMFFDHSIGYSMEDGVVGNITMTHD